MYLVLLLIQQRGGVPSLQDPQTINRQDRAPKVKVTQNIGVDDFELLKVVGQGAFGKVFQVKRNGTSEIYAMKVMRKDRIMEKNHAEYIKADRDIMTRIVHPFIVQLRYSFQVPVALSLNFGYDCFFPAILILNSIVVMQRCILVLF